MASTSSLPSHHPAGTQPVTVSHYAAGNLSRRLPFEIRLKIYAYILAPAIDDADYSKTQERWNRRYGAPPTKPNGAAVTSKPPSSGILALLTTCRLISVEATHLLYSTNHFAFIEPYIPFFDRIGPTNTAHVKDIWLRERYPCLTPRDISAVVERATGLARFAFDSHVMSCAPPRDPYVLDFYRMVWPLFEKRMLERGETWRAVSKYPRGWLWMGEKGRYPDWEAIIVAFVRAGEALKEGEVMMDMQGIFDSFEKVKDSRIVNPWKD